MVGHSPTNMHMGACVYVANVAQHKSIPRINSTSNQKILGLYSLVKDLGIIIHK
jgi:hypothetical protein